MRCLGDVLDDINQATSGTCDTAAVTGGHDFMRRRDHVKRHNSRPPPEAPRDFGGIPGRGFYIALNELTTEEPGINKVGDVIAVDQVIYDPATNTAYAKPLSALDQQIGRAHV